MFHCMIPSRVAVAASCLLIGLGAAFSAHAGEDAEGAKPHASCQKEVWRVSVNRGGGSPRTTMLPRYEQRTVLVCDEKVFSELKREVSIKANDSRNNGGG